MCGIAGILLLNGPNAKIEAISKMTSALSHRGPDATGFYEDEHIALGHKRLSIIDLSDCSNQPMRDHTGRYHIAFNGEIYNYQQIKYELKNYPFSTNGDTEVILAAYSTWGPECLSRLAGMFAFAIWDKQEKKLFIARDRLGVKPLYYYDTDGVFLFASEIRSLLASGVISKKINPEAVSQFLQFQSTGHPHTIVKGVKSIEAGSYMIISPQTKTAHQYWSVFNSRPDFDFDNTTAVNAQISSLLRQSVQRRMVSDVPVAAFLSGGIDSSAVVALMSTLSQQPVNTFTVGFKEKEFDESGYAQLVADRFHTHHQQILLKAEDFLNDLLPALDAMDSPTGDGINSFIVCRAIRNNDIKVALSGVGGDELFAGYPIFKQYLRLMKMKSYWRSLKPVRSLVALAVGENNTKADRYRKLLKAQTADISSFYPQFRQIISHRMLSECSSLPLTENNQLLKRHCHSIKELPLLSHVSVAEYLGYTQHTLLNDMDQMSMASSLEVREPFFDHDLIEFVLNVPDEQKYPHYPKKLLVEAMGTLLPSEIVHRRKQGFLFPWNSWMKNELRTFCESHLDRIAEREFMKRDGLMNIWKRFLNNDTTVRWMEIWLFVVLEYWLQKNNVD